MGGLLVTPQAEAQVRIPPPLAPFEYLVGGWKGTGIPTANRLKGWSERHVWSWKFVEGRPVALTVALSGNRQLTQAELTHDAATGAYRLDGTDPSGQPVRLVGSFDDSGRLLVLKPNTPTEAAEQLTVRLFDNQIRYVIWVDRQERGRPRPLRVVEVGLTKDGEAFASGGVAASTPKCVVTGGSATLSVTYQGKSYPLCCTGCRDEFLENPEKYLAKVAGQVPASSSTPTPTPAPTPAPVPAPETSPDKTTQPPPARVGQPDPQVRAASLLRIAQALERSGKRLGALEYYRRIVQEHPRSPEAQTAAGRITALEGK
jgi:YHS domain-containing protein